MFWVKTTKPWFAGKTPDLIDATKVIPARVNINAWLKTWKRLLILRKLMKNSSFDVKTNPFDGSKCGNFSYNGSHCCVKKKCINSSIFGFKLKPQKMRLWWQNTTLDMRTQFEFVYSSSHWSLYRTIFATSSLSKNYKNCGLGPLHVAPDTMNRNIVIRLWFTNVKSTRIFGLCLWIKSTKKSCF